MVAKYRKKPVDVEAMQFTGENEAEIKRWQYIDAGGQDAPAVWFQTNYYDKESRSYRDAAVWDRLHRTWIGMDKGHYIIRGIKGEFYPVEEKVFEETYEQVSGD